MAYTYGNLVNIIDNELKLQTPSDQVADFMLLYVAGTPIREAARAVGLPEDRPRQWRRMDWWARIESAARQVASQAADRKLSKVLDKAIANISERIDKGDPYTAQGHVHFQPVSARDLAIILGVVYDNRALIRGEATQLTGEVKSEEDRLKELSEAFKEISKGRPELKAVK
jgi:hypothetical protein